MTREQYLTYRKAGSIDPVYHYYNEHCKKDCLDIHKFIQWFQMWPQFFQVHQQILQMYDVKYEVTTVQDLKTGQILKYL